MINYRIEKSGKKWTVSTFSEPNVRKSRNGPLFLILFFLLTSSAYADIKQWTGRDDAVSWNKEGNWFANGVPTIADTVVVNLQGASAEISNINTIFKAESLTVGGRTDATITAKSFVYGLIEPASSADYALYIRKGGLAVLQGTGIITLKGQFKSSEELIPDEPAFVFGAE